MSSAKTVQLPRYQTETSWRKTKRCIKRQTAKAMRRAGKRMLDDAPKSVIQGWAD